MPWECSIRPDIVGKMILSFGSTAWTGKLDLKHRVAACIREMLLPVFESGYVRLPSHLKSVPKWQQYMFCGDSVPMAVIYKAREKGLFLNGVDYPVPAALLVYEKV